MEEYKHSELTGKIIGCAMQVHSFLGCGFQEMIYHRALALELTKAKLDYKWELEMPIYYKDYIEPLGVRRVDFLIENKVLIELKAKSCLEDQHYAQLLNYLKVYKIEIGLLINFGEKSLNFKRIILTDRSK